MGSGLVAGMQGTFIRRLQQLLFLAIPTVPMAEADFDLRYLLESLSLKEANYPQLVAAYDYSHLRIREARAALASIGANDGVATFAVGSLGRREASDQSDLDFAFVFEPSELEFPERALEELSTVLKEADFDVSEKTFAKPLSIVTLT